MASSKSLQMPRSPRQQRALAEASLIPSTPSEMGIDPVTALRLEQRGYLVRKGGVIHTGRRGRPTVLRSISRRAARLGDEAFATHLA